MKSKALQGEYEQSILDARAKELAKNMADKYKSIGDSFLLFCLGMGKDENYAISYQCVERVVPLLNLTGIPGVSDLFLGITYYNAEIWPVINTEVLFALSVEKTIEPEYLVLLKHGTYRYAFAVQYILGHRMLDTSRGLAQVAKGKVHGNDYILGVSAQDISIVDDKKIFDFMNALSIE